MEWEHPLWKRKCIGRLLQENFLHSSVKHSPMLQFPDCSLHRYP